MFFGLFCSSEESEDSGGAWGFEVFFVHLGQFRELLFLIIRRKIAELRKSLSL